MSMHQVLGRGVVTALAPMRVSLAGGGTDLPSYHLNRGGRVLSLAIDRYVCVSVFERSFDGVITTRFDRVVESPRAGLVPNSIARAALVRLGRDGDLQIASHSDVPWGSGLGSSGAFSVALLHALGGGKANRSTDLAKLANLASDIEMIDLGRSVGRHDHYMATFGGLRDLAIGPDGDVEPRLVGMPPGFTEFVEQRLLLFYIGGARDASAALSVQDERTRAGDRDVVTALKRIHELANEASDLVESGDYDALGRLLHQHWEYKRRLSPKVSNNVVDALYESALRAGATGGKLLGAGGGGFLLLHVPDKAAASSVRTLMAGHGRQELTFACSVDGVRATTLEL